MTITTSGDRWDFCLRPKVVDYKMAELDGLELALRLRRLRVATPIILITGYPDEKHLGQGQLGRSATGAFEAQP